LIEYTAKGDGIALAGQTFKVHLQYKLASVITSVPSWKESDIYDVNLIFNLL
jgi:hypothetical protein